MLTLLRYWIIGIVALAAAIGVVVLGFMAYEFVYKEFFIGFISIVFLVIPITVGLIACKIKETYIDKGEG